LRNKIILSILLVCLENVVTLQCPLSVQRSVVTAASFGDSLFYLSDEVGHLETVFMYFQFHVSYFFIIYQMVEII